VVWDRLVRRHINPGGMVTVIRVILVLSILTYLGKEPGGIGGPSTGFNHWDLLIIFPYLSTWRPRAKTWLGLVNTFQGPDREGGNSPLLNFGNLGGSLGSKGNFFHFLRSELDWGLFLN